MLQPLSALAETVTVDPETSPEVGVAVMVAGIWPAAVSAWATGMSDPRIAALSRTPEDTAARRERNERIIGM